MGGVSKTMKHLYLTRTSDSPLCTMGSLHYNGLPFLSTMENPWRFNEPYVSCIPEGTYIVKPYNSEKYHKTYKVQDVPGRTGILFHTGNFEQDTEGCILPGLMAGELAGKPAVKSSALAMKALEDLVGKEDFVLTIKKG